MNEFEKALIQVKNGEQVTEYGCETRKEQHLLAFVYKKLWEDQRKW